MYSAHYFISEESVKYVKIFTGIERLPQLIKYYVKCEKSFLCQKWKNIVDVDQDRGIQELLSQFYQDLLLEYHTQVYYLFVEVFICILSKYTSEMQIICKNNPGIKYASCSCNFDNENSN